MVPAENDAALGSEVRNNFLPARKIPFPDHRLNTAPVNRALRREDHVDRHDLNSPLEISTKNPGQVVRGQYASGATADIKELCSIGLAEAQAASAENSPFPCAFLNGIRRSVLRRNGRTGQKQQNHYAENLHELPRLHPSPADLLILEGRQSFPVCSNPAERETSCLYGQGASIENRVIAASVA